MSTPAARNHIRTEESRLREATAKQLVEKVLRAAGFEVLDRRLVSNRFFIHVRDSSGDERTLWFKLGWNPEDHETSAVQIEMIKPREGDPPPSEWPDAKVVNEVSEKISRGKRAGATHLLLFSLDKHNRTPIACLLMPIDQVAPCFTACMQIDARQSRNGASPALWLRGVSDITNHLQRVVESYASEDLLKRDARSASFEIDDAYNDLTPEPSIVGNRNPERRVGQVAHFPRDEAVRENALKRANGRCEFCDQEGFLTESGGRYLESHHIQALGKDGPDTEDNVIAVCANDHRAAHFSAEKEAIAERMRAILRGKLEQHGRRRLERTA